MQNEPTIGDSPTEPGAGAHPVACENCATPLQGEYCHACGQSSHNPLRHVGHAIEEVFESFWHLDGRIFRTLRLLFAPGRVARDYLAGHRVRFIPPLRLFVILSLLTFFVGKVVLHFEPQINIDGEQVGFQDDKTVAAVEQHRDRLLAKLRADEDEDARSPGANAGLIATRARIQGQAATRIAELRTQQHPRMNAAEAAEAAATPATPPAAAAPPTTGAAGASAAATPGSAGKAKADNGTGDGKAGDGDGAAKDDAASANTPVDEDPDLDCAKLRADPDNRVWLPAFADRWINTRVVRACENFRHVDTEGGRLFQAGLAAVPTALFVLMPVFALLLKLLYLGSGRSYLEHLVVALYSHAFLLLMLLALFLLSAAESVGVPGWLRGLGYAAVWIWMPIYLWKMQRRVYGGGWLSNLARYTVIGCTYFVLVSLATAYAVLIGISS